MTTHKHQDPDFIVKPDELKHQFPFVDLSRALAGRHVIQARSLMDPRSAITQALHRCGIRYDELILFLCRHPALPKILKDATLISCMDSCTLSTAWLVLLSETGGLLSVVPTGKKSGDDKNALPSDIWNIVRRGILSNFTKNTQDRGGEDPVSALAVENIKNIKAEIRHDSIDGVICRPDEMGTDSYHTGKPPAEGTTAVAVLRRLAIAASTRIMASTAAAQAKALDVQAGAPGLDEVVKLTIHATMEAVFATEDMTDQRDKEGHRIKDFPDDKRQSLIADATIGSYILLVQVILTLVDKWNKEAAMLEEEENAKNKAEEAKASS